jgi:hypothetical protein
VIYIEIVKGRFLEQDSESALGGDFLDDLHCMTMIFWSICVVLFPLRGAKSKELGGTSRRRVYNGMPRRQHSSSVKGSSGAGERRHVVIAQDAIKVWPVS